MAMSPTEPSAAPPSPEQERRAAARRTAITFGLIAAAIYVAFILSGVIGR